MSIKKFNFIEIGFGIWCFLGLIQTYAYNYLGFKWLEHQPFIFLGIIIGSLFFLLSLGFIIKKLWHKNLQV